MWAIEKRGHFPNTLGDGVIALNTGEMGVKRRKLSKKSTGFLDPLLYSFCVQFNSVLFIYKIYFWELT